MEFPFLFSPIDINGLTLKNRIVMTAMHMGYTPEGVVTDRLIDFYVERAKGGVGLILVGGCPIDEFAGMSSMICIHEDRYIPGLKRLTSAIQKNGAKIGAQLYQAGRYTHSSMIGGRKPFSASAVRSKLTGETPRALDIEEISGVQDKYAEAAVRAIEAGFDAVEILGSAGYLISQFLSPLTNLREDDYGGTLENRMRFGLEVIEKVRKAVGPEFPILMRLAGNDFMKNGNTNEESKMFAAEAEKMGVDLFNVTGGWHETRIPQLTMFVPRSAYVYLARGIKSAVTVPVLTSNRINTPVMGEKILRNGEADLVTMARALLVDPELPNKAQNGDARRIYHCIACNQGCFDNIFSFKPVTCLVNPRAGRESELILEKTSQTKTVLVIGGGPAGMKAACTAAERGHSVTLVEKEKDLGGQVVMNQRIPGREEMVSVSRDLSFNLKALGVKVLLGTEAHMELITQTAPDSVVIATGAEPVFPDIPGTDNHNVVQAWDVLSEKVHVGKKVIIVGGNAVGLETALYLANLGVLSPEVLHFLVINRAESMDTLNHWLNTGSKQVTVIEMAKKSGRDIGASTRWTVMTELNRLGVTIKTHTKAEKISPDGLEIIKDGAIDFIPADTIVLAVGSKPNTEWISMIKEHVPDVHVIGDAKLPRDALEAVKEGYLTGLKV